MEIDYGYAKGTEGVVYYLTVLDSLECIGQLSIDELVGAPTLQRSEKVRSWASVL